MHHCESGQAVRCIGAFAGSVDVCIGSTSNCDVRIPNTHITWASTSHIHLQNNGTRRDIGDCKAHVLNLGNTDIASIADLHDGVWVGAVAKMAADAGYHGPSFSDDAGSPRDK